MTVRYMSVSLKRLQTLRKMKICPGRKSNRLTSLVSSAKELFLWVVAVRNADILASLALYHTSRPKVMNKKKVPGPNMKKKNGCKSFIPITPMLPNEPPQWHMWIKRHMMPLHNLLIIHCLWLNSVIIKSHILSPTSSNKIRKALHYHWEPSSPVHHVHYQKKQKITSADEDVEKLEPLHPLVGI